MIFLTLPLPPGINATYQIGYKKLIKTDRAKTWEDEAAWKIKQAHPPLYLESKIAVHMEVYFNRDRDIDSSVKIVLDLLQTMGIYKNDKQVYFLQVGKQFVEKDATCIEVFIDNYV